jgi:predicted DNA-binding transcriptional regulator AlpA
MQNTPLTKQTNANPVSSQWLTEKEVATITRLSLSTLRSHRFIGKGIPYAKIGRSVRYSATEVQRYMTEHQVVQHKVSLC